MPKLRIGEECSMVRNKALTLWTEEKDILIGYCTGNEKQKKSAMNTHI